MITMIHCVNLIHTAGNLKKNTYHYQLDQVHLACRTQLWSLKICQEPRKDATDEDATDEDETDEDATNEDATNEDATNEDATDEDATD